MDRDPESSFLLKLQNELGILAEAVITPTDRIVETTIEESCILSWSMALGRWSRVIEKVT